VPPKRAGIICRAWLNFLNERLTARCLVTSVLMVERNPGYQSDRFLNTSPDFSHCGFVSLQPEVAVTSPGCTLQCPPSAGTSTPST
jgi:hypothetical protein